MRTVMTVISTAYHTSVCNWQFTSVFANTSSFNILLPSSEHERDFKTLASELQSLNPKTQSQYRDTLLSQLNLDKNCQKAFRGSRLGSENPKLVKKITKGPKMSL